MTDDLAGRRPRRPRGLHPAAWWLWALGLAVAATTTTNPLLLAIALAVSAVVVVARRSDDPWARAYRLYLVLGLAIVVLRVLLHVAVGLKFGDHVVVRLPAATMPAWAAGIQLGGTVYAEGLISAAVQGFRLAVLVTCIGGANALANPKRMLRTLPGALHEIGVSVVVSVTVAPQLAESVQRVARARRLRGDNRRGLGAVRRTALPVLQDTLDRSLLLAAAMDSRGFGRAVDGSRRQRNATSTLVLLGLLGACLGSYGLLDTQSPAALGVPVLLAGLALALAGLWAGGRRVHRTTYRPDPWRAPEWCVAVSGGAAAACLLVTARLDPLVLAMPVQPLALPALPWFAVLGLVVAALPAVIAPDPLLQGQPSATRPAGSREGG